MLHEEDTIRKAIHDAVNNPKPEPKLPCHECLDIPEEKKGKNCGYYKDCLVDWQRVEDSRIRNGK